MLSMNQKEITDELFERKHIGFTVLKDWRTYMSKIENIMNQPFFTQNAESKYISALIKVIGSIEVMCVIYQNLNLFTNTGEKTDLYKVIDGNELNPENPKDEFLLVKNLKEGGVQVVDFGTIRKYNIDNGLNFMTINGDNFMNWSRSIKELFESIDLWVENTGNHLLIDPLTFRI